MEEEIQMTGYSIKLFGILHLTRRLKNRKQAEALMGDLGTRHGFYTISANISFSRIDHMIPPRCSGAAKCILTICTMKMPVLLKI